MPIKGEQQGYTYKALINGEWQEVTIQESPSELVERFEQDEEWTRVRHGHWVHGKELSRDYIGDACVNIHYDKWWCSECNYPVEEQPLWMYCPNCGAKMKEENEDG